MVRRVCAGLRRGPGRGTGTGIRWLIGRMAWQSGTETGKETLGGTGGGGEVSPKKSETPFLSARSKTRIRGQATEI